jgi:excisionase family DNA binding protein
MENYKKRVLSFNEGCEYLGFKKSYVYKLTSAGILPYSKPNGKCIKFDIYKLDEWLLSNESNSISDRKKKAATYINLVK